VTTRITNSTKIEVGDVLAGISVAIVLIPQSLAYAQIAGLPPHIGLFASALPPLLAALFASSPYLQTGPVALTSLLTIGALSGLETTGTANYIQLAALLAIVVGVARLILGLLRLGSIAYLMSEPVVLGFTSAAGILIISSQIPTIFDVSAPNGTTLSEAGWTLIHPGDWRIAAVIIAVATVALVMGGRRVSPLFPGVLFAVIGAMAYHAAFNYEGSLVPDLPSGWITLSIDLPWDQLGSLIVPGIIIALVGFAEPASISRTFATQDRIPWSANRELVSQGVANLASGLSGGFPVGGSFSRSSLNRLAGAKTRFSGAVTGAVVLAALPIAPVLENLPRAALGAIVFAAVINLVRIRPMLAMWRQSRVQAIVSGGTFAATLALAPNVERGVIIGVGLAIVAHLYRETRVASDSAIDGDTLTIWPRGVMWFAATPALEHLLTSSLDDAGDVDHIIIDLGAVGRMDYSGGVVLKNVVNDFEIRGIDVSFRNVPDHALRALAVHLGGRCDVPELNTLSHSVRHQHSLRRRQND
jgi:SulP family sulfate permease